MVKKTKIEKALYLSALVWYSVRQETRPGKNIPAERSDNMAKKETRERSAVLYETIAKLKDADECRRFFEDLCTPTEMRAMEQRFDVAVFLQQGWVYLDILEKTGASSATISRVNRSLSYGTGAYERLFKRMKKK
jgi:TrpR-related protein YerC/YecD